MGVDRVSRLGPPPPTAAARMPEKFPGSDPVQLARLIADAAVGHVAFSSPARSTGSPADEQSDEADRWPSVLPIAITYEPAGPETSVGFSLLLHGSTGSRWLRTLAQGVPIAVAVTAVDGLVVARSAFESSMHYRSAVLFGHCQALSPGDKPAALDRITESLIPGRTAEVRPSRPKELAATLVLRMRVLDWSYKVSDGWPDDPEDDVAGSAWAGVLPRRTGFTEARDTHDLAPGIGRPPSVSALLDD
jgi:nitroimidazol reductase NimA-like FMN-containing flavoprotein (pyridoxamine 5'-phosphate oxidase superfamily)